MNRKMMLRLLPLVSVLLIAGCGGSMGVNTEDSDVTGNEGQVEGKSLATVYIQLASAYLRNGNMGAALENAKKAVAAGPRNSQASHILAAVYQSLGEKKLAEKHYKRAMKQDRQNSDAANGFGGFLCAEGRYAEADKYFQQSLTNPLYRTPWVSYTNAGICADRSGNVETAEQYFRQALTANPRYTPALLPMAQLGFDSGNYVSAKAYLQRYAEISPPSAKTLSLSAETEWKLGNREQARAYEMLLRSNFPDSVEVQTLNRAR